jgi:hypothetical protein
VVNITAALRGAASSVAFNAFVHGTRTTGAARPMRRALPQRDGMAVVCGPRETADVGLPLPSMQRKHHGKLHFGRRDRHECVDVFGQPNDVGPVACVGALKPVENIHPQRSVFCRPRQNAGEDRDPIICLPWLQLRKFVMPSDDISAECFVFQSAIRASARDGLEAASGIPRNAFQISSRGCCSSSCALLKLASQLAFLFPLLFGAA